MPAQKGKALLIQLGSGVSPESFATVAGLRSTALAFNAQTVDVTHAESEGWRELLGGAGLRSAAITGAGIFKDAASDAALRALFFDAAVRTMRVVIPDFGTVTGPFQIAALEYAGEHAGEVTWTMSLASAGPLVFEAAP